MAKPKILFILHLPPPVHGAAMVGQFIRESGMVNGKFDADYVSLTTSFRLDRIGRGDLAKFSRVLKILKHVVSALLKNKYDVCYITLSTHGLGFYKDLLIVMVVKLFNVKIVYHFHNKGVEKHSRYVFNRWLYRLAFNGTRSILLSPKLYPDLQRYVRKTDVHYCPNGVPDMAYQSANHALTASGGLCKFLFLSNMTLEKGVKVLLEACHILHGQNMGFECHYVGDWSGMGQAEFQKEVEELGLAGKVFVHGPKYDGEKFEFFRTSHAFVFPTQLEVFGLVNLEAMQQSLPVIATIEGGIPDIVIEGETGFLVSTADPFGLAEKMKELIQNPELRVKMGKAGRKRYEQHYTLEIFENRIAQILNQIILS